MTAYLKFDVSVNTPHLDLDVILIQLTETEISPIFLGAPLQTNIFFAAEQLEKPNSLV